MSLSSGSVACSPSFLNTGLDVRSMAYGSDDCSTVTDLRPSKRIRLQDGGSGETDTGVTSASPGQLPADDAPPLAADDVTVGMDDQDNDTACGMGSTASTPGSAAPAPDKPKAEPYSPGCNGSVSVGSHAAAAAHWVPEQPDSPPSSDATSVHSAVRRAGTFPQIRVHPSPHGPRAMSLPAEGSSSSTSTASQQVMLLPRQQLPDGQRGISLLLTFTDDSHKHVERVIRLGECLRKNGFTVTVDMPQQCFQTAAEAEHFLRSRFEGSDYVLACVSPKYKMETESATPAGHSYHSKLVSELILTGRRASIAAGGGSGGTSSSIGGNRPQLLCLYLADVDESSTPAWLRNMRPLQYQWPRNFRDVLFCLSKPQRLFEMQAFPDLRHLLPESSDLD